MVGRRLRVLEEELEAFKKDLSNMQVNYGADIYNRGLFRTIAVFEEVLELIRFVLTIIDDACVFYSVGAPATRRPKRPSAVVAPVTWIVVATLVVVSHQNRIRKFRPVHPKRLPFGLHRRYTAVRVDGPRPFELANYQVVS